MVVYLWSGVRGTTYEEVRLGMFMVSPTYRGVKQGCSAVKQAAQDEMPLLLVSIVSDRV